jgi:hypothetical protein
MEGGDRPAGIGATALVTELRRTQLRTTETTPVGRADAGGSATDPPRLERRDVIAALLGHGLDLGDGGRRYVVDGLLGVGSGGRVYAATDSSLARPLAMKVLPAASPSPDEARGFIAEARITASLSHPNVLPVYELDLAEDGSLYFTMQRVDGHSLGTLVDAATAPGPVAALGDLVRILIGVAQALAYAHHRGIVHQDLKPDNIMLGRFGEVLVVDWGSAAHIDAAARPTIYGTPLYMSPEQARIERVDRLSDIYCFGATMFHALVGRLPAWSDDAEVFWEKKRRGLIDPPTPAERRRLPRPLLAIALKALAADPAQRYASAGDLLQDLLSYQAGLAVRAHAESWFEQARRWHRRHARTLWTSLTVGAVILTLAGLLYGERLKELARWGRALPGTAFDEDWSKRWVVALGAFDLRDGRLVSTAPGESLLIWPHRFSGAIAVEYEAECLPGSRPCDLSLMWCQELGPPAANADAAHRDAPTPVGRVDLQVGAYDGSSVQIAGTVEGALGFAYFSEHPGRRYRIRHEIEDGHLTISVDGQVVCDSHASMPMSGGYVGLRGYFPGKAFGDVRIFVREIPERLPATALGDLLVRKQQALEAPTAGGAAPGPSQRYREAADEYRHVSDAHPGTSLAREAAYREGLCALWDHRYDDAERIWAPLQETSAYRDRLAIHRIDIRFQRGEHDAVLQDLDALVAAGGSEIRHQAAREWSSCVGALTHIPRPTGWQQALPKYIAAHDHLFSDDAITDRNCAGAMLALGWYRKVLARFPKLEFERINALMQMNRFDLAMRESDDPNLREVFLFNTGRGGELPATAGFKGWSLYKQARLDELDAAFPDNRFVHGVALIARGRLDEALRTYGDLDTVRVRALAMQGRAGEAVTSERSSQAEQAFSLADGQGTLALSTPGQAKYIQARYLLGLQAWIRGDHTEAERWLTREPLPDTYTRWEYELLLTPLLHGLAGDWSLLDSRCREVRADMRYFDNQYEWYDASYLVGAIGESEFLSQPYHLFAESCLRRLQGMRAEREGRVADALTAYRAYLALPMWRRNDEVDPIWDTLVAWRVEQLAASSTPAAP